MVTIDAVYQNGVFKPLSAVALPDNQRVRLDVQLRNASDIEDWLIEAQRLQQSILARFGPLPDSTPEIAADRMGDD